MNGDIFLASEGIGLEHGAGKIDERLGRFGTHETLSDSREEATKGRVEIGSAEKLSTKRFRDELTEFLTSGEASML
jgi:hypothetical protein